MTDIRNVLERVGDRVPMPEPAFERILRRRERRRRSQRIAAGVVGLALAAALILGLTHLDPGRSRRPVTVPTLPTNGWIAYSGTGTSGEDHDIYITREGVDPRKIVGSDDDVRTDQWCPEFSPDGSMLAYSEATPRDGADPAIVVTAIAPSGAPVGQEQRIEIPSIDEPRFLCAEWAPDSRRLAYSANGVWVASLGGGPPRRISGDSQIADFEWSPDGSAVALSGGDGINIVSTVDGALLSYAAGIPGGELTWSPDGDQIALGGGDWGKNHGIQVIDARDGAVRTLETGDPSIGGSPAWSPDGTKIAFVHDGRIVLTNPDTGGVVILPRVTEGGASNPITSSSSVQWSPDGRWLLGLGGAGGRFAVVAAPADGSASAILMSRLTFGLYFATAADLDWQGVHA